MLTCYTVSELNYAVKTQLESAWPLVQVSGELSQCKKYPSGHLYFVLKDNKAQVRAVMFASRNSRLNFSPREGMAVIITARLTLYEARGDYQLTVDWMEEAGDGLLKRAFEALKRQLNEEGLFDDRFKKPLPSLPKCIGLITSPQGAAIHDILTTLAKRFPAIPILIYPTAVQGDQAPEQIAKQIEQANLDENCDLLIVGRGGGSLEDLQAFNTERVARAIFNCHIPIISAVGHEVDITISDLVADKRAPTPTAAAQLAVPDGHEWLIQFSRFEQQLTLRCHSYLQRLMQTLDFLTRRLKHPQEKLQQGKEKLGYLNQQLQQKMRLYLAEKRHEHLSLTQALGQQSPTPYIEKQKLLMIHLNQRLNYSIDGYLNLKKQALALMVHQLDQLSPLGVLARGYAILYQQDHKTPIRTIKDLPIKGPFSIQLSDGQAEAHITKIIKSTNSPKKVEP